MFLPWSILPSFLSGRRGKASERHSSPSPRRWKKAPRPGARTLSLEPLETRVVPATIFVDVTNPVAGTGTALNPFKHLQDAVKQANANAGIDDIFVFGNTSGNPQNVYVWTRDGDRNSDGLQDGTLFIASNDSLTFRAQTLLQGPSGAPAPVIVKMADNIIDIAGRLRIEGAAGSPVILTSFQDDAAGGDTNNDGNISQPQRLDWGGIRFRGGAADQGPGSASGSFVSFADIRYTGATLFDPLVGVPIEFASVRMEYDGTNAVAVRVWDTTFQHGGKALDVHFKSLAGTGPDVGGGGGTGPAQGAQHPLTFIDNTLNGLFVNIPFVPIIPLYDVDSQWDDVGVPYVLTQRLKLDQADLIIDPGMVVKFQNNAIVDASLASTDNGSSPTNRIIVNGTIDKPVLFTSLSDDDLGTVLSPYYTNGSADTNNDGPGNPQPGDWGGIRVANGNIDHAFIRYGGGSVPIGTGFFVNQSPLEIQTFDLRPLGPLQDFRVSNTDISLSLGVVPTVDVSGDGLITIIDNNIHDNQGLAIQGASSTYGTFYHPLGGYGIHYRRNVFSNNANNGVFTDTIGGTGYLDDTDITLTIGTSISVGGAAVRQIQSRREAIPYVDINNPAIGTAVDYLRRFKGTGLGNAQFLNFIAQLQGQGINQGPFAAFPGDNGLFFRLVDFETTSRQVSIPGVAAGAPGNIRGEEWRDIGVDFVPTNVTGLFPLKALNAGGSAISGTNILTTADLLADDTSMDLIFPNMVSAVGFWIVNNPNTTANEAIEFYGDQNQLLESIPLPSTASGPVFIGRISKAPIYRIHIRENSSDGNLAGIDDLYYVDASESLLIKMSDNTPTVQVRIEAGGFDGGDANPNTGALRLGPTLRILGQPDSPVQITSIHDDSLATGPVGSRVGDVNNNGLASSPVAGLWTGIQIRPGVNSSKIEYVSQLSSGTIVRESSDRNPYTIGDETSINPLLTSIPDAITRTVSGALPAEQNVQDGTLIEHALITFADIGIDNQGYPDGKLTIEMNESEANDTSATSDVLVPFVQTENAATRVGASSFVSGFAAGQWDVDFYQLTNLDEPLGGVPQGAALVQSYGLPGAPSLIVHVDVDHTPNVPPTTVPRRYNIYAFNSMDQLVYIQDLNFTGQTTNFMGNMLEVSGDFPANFSSDPAGSDWDAEYVVIAPRNIVPRVLIPTDFGGRLNDNIFPQFLSLPGGQGFAVIFVDMDGAAQDTLTFSDFMHHPLAPLVSFGPQGYEVEFRSDNQTTAGLDIHFGQASDAIRPTDGPVTITRIEAGVPVQRQAVPAGGIIFRQNLITNFLTAGIVLQDQVVTVASQAITTQAARYFYPNRDPFDTNPSHPTFTNPNFYVPGVYVYNNVIANGKGNGITVTEQPINPQILVITGYHQIHNNTIYNNEGNGIDLTTRGGPNVLDNIIVKNAVGVDITDLGLPGATTVVNYNLFFQNVNNIVGTSNGGNNIFNANPLFVDQDNLDLRVFARPGGATSPAVDAALSNLSDRLFAMRDPDVPTRVPNDDFRERARNDNPARSNVGTGEFPFFDLGAYETNEAALRVISLSPFFTTTGVVPGPVAAFEVQFAGRVDPATVSSTTVKVRRSGVNQPIALITNVYDPVRDIHTFTFTFSVPLGDGNYTIFMDGTAPNNSDPAIRDIAGQLMDGEFPPPATAPENSFPSGNNVPGGDFNYAFTIVTSSIGDLVWNDLNGDGIKQGSEPGISNVTIDLRAAGPDGIAGTGDDIILPSQVTNASGNYVFANLNPGQYLVDVRDSTLPQNFVITNPPDPRIINLSIADQRTDIDFGYREDLQNATIGDLVYNDQNNDGVKQPGEPGIGGVKIDLLGSGPDLVLGTPDDVIFPPQFTSASGAYVFANLPGWRYRIDVDDTSPSLAGFGLTTGNDPLTVTLDPGQQFLTADFGYIEKNSAIGDLVWEDTDGSGTLNGLEVGLAGVQVFIDLNNNDAFDVGEPTANTDANGAYQIGSLSPGTYKVMVNFSTLPPGNYVASTTHPLTIVLGSNDTNLTADFGFRIDPQNSQLGGQVFTDLFGDGNFTAGDTGLAGINIQLTWAGRDGIFGNGDDQVFGPFPTNGSGNWSTLADRPSGNYRVLVQNPPGAGFVQTTPGGNPRSVTLAISEVNTNINFGYQQRQASIGDRVWRDDNGDGIQDAGEPGINGVSVNLRYAGPDGALDTGDDLLQGPVVTSGDGNYTFSNLGAGLYRITVTPFGLGSTNGNPRLVNLLGGAPADSINTVDFGFQTANSGIGDRVFNDLNGDGIQQGGEIGIAGVQVFIDVDNSGTLTGGDATTNTNSSGFYQFLGLTAGSYRIIVDQTSLPGGTVPTIPNPPDVTVLVAADQVRNDVDFGFLLPPGTPGGIFYLTVKNGTTLTNSDNTAIVVSDTDIIKLVVSTDGSFTYSLYFKGKDFGLAPGSEQIDAFSFLSDGDILISTIGSFSVKPNYTAPQQGSGTNITGFGEDILRFRPTAADANGRITAGSYRNFAGTGTGLYFDGSTKGLSGTSENIDAVSVLADGRILISTVGSATVPGLAAQREWDLLAYQPSGNAWSVYFDGDDVGLTGSAENINGLGVGDPTAALPILYLSTTGNFNVPGVTGDKKDVFAFNPSNLGTNTAGSFGPGLVLDGSQTGMPSGMDITGLFFGVAPGLFPLHAAGTATLPAADAGNLRWVEADGQVNVFIDGGNGLFDEAETARIRDALAVLNATWQQAGGPQLVEVTDASQADIRVSSQAGSLVGGVSQGVLGSTQVSYAVNVSGTLANGETFRQILGHDYGMLTQVVLIDGWDWYAGSDPAGIGATQFDLQSVAAHELGHAAGLLDSQSSSDDVMFESLMAGQVRRSYSDLDLASLDELYAAGAQLNGSVTPADVAAPASITDTSLEPEIFKLLNPAATGGKSTSVEVARKSGTSGRKTGLPLASADRQAADELFAATGASSSTQSKSEGLESAPEWWMGLPV